LEERSFTGGRERGMENEDGQNCWERAFKYEGIRGCQDESTEVNGRVVTRHHRVVSRVPFGTTALTNKCLLLWTSELHRKDVQYITRANSNDE